MFVALSVFLLFALQGLATPIGVGPNALGPNGGITTLGNDTSSADIVYCGEIDDPIKETTGDPEQGPGFWITNKDVDPNVKYFLYENSRNRHPWKYLSVPQNGRAFVQVCNTWQGRVVRGTLAVNGDGGEHNLATWMESNVDANGVMWGDVSFLEGCDGGGSVAATDNSGEKRECLVDMLTGAPAAALATKATGTKVIAPLVGVNANAAAAAWDATKCSADTVWLNNDDSEPVISSSNGRFEYVFFKGKA
ncbi:hypothetical protein F4780DRAFT_779566 [Xylariomycetidae sp. FL0641]|nr:hypothetical protein F4780DRAFT_779566 [Xylariomycetidae sp. FL0641]